jgi:hypothetical protein
MLSLSINYFASHAKGIAGSHVNRVSVLVEPKIVNTWLSGSTFDHGFIFQHLERRPVNTPFQLVRIAVNGS